MTEPMKGAFSQERDLPWGREMGLESVIDLWGEDRARNLFLSRVIPPQEARYSPFPTGVPEGVVKALASRGVEQLYSHQAEAITHAMQGRDVVIATPTASGKSLCYNLPVLSTLSTDDSARALYLFPTKALSRDQEQALRGLMNEAGVHAGAITYDGDTPGDARRAGRERSAVLLTNPDMLHAGILPHHTRWARLFANLRYIVLDELHTYRGIFGSHLANVLRRLRRVAEFHGADPTFIFSSATIGNPAEHASRMIGRKVELVDQSGAPTGPRHVLAYNPPVVNAEIGIRQSYIKATVSLTRDLIRAEVPTIVFGGSRTAVETMLKYLRDGLKRDDIDRDAIMAYRGGYLPQQRRNIEQGLRDGTIRCVVATSALELGIDIGSLQSVVCAGYPGSVAGLWQRFGRAGRRGGPSLSLLVCSSAPLDQFLARSPETVFGGGVEHARIDPDNVEILIQHLKCAAFELPFIDGDDFGDLPKAALDDALEFLSDNELVHAAPGPDGKQAFHWSSDAYPASHVSLRSVGWDNFVIIDLDGDRTLAEMDWRSVHTMLHEQAIYQHDGAQYQVERLDYDNRKAFIRRVKPDYYTTALTHTKVSVLEQDSVSDLAELGLSAPIAQLHVAKGEVSVIDKVVGFKKIKFHTHENCGYGDVHLPEMEMHTAAFWVTFPEAIVEAQPAQRPIVIDAIRGIAHAMHVVGALGAMVDPRDLGRALGDKSGMDEMPQKGGDGVGFDPTVFLFDRAAGGVGIADRLYQVREDLLRRTRSLIEGCDCEGGCPSCVGPTIGEHDTPSSASRRALALSVLAAGGVRATH